MGMKTFKNRFTIGLAFALLVGSVTTVLGQARYAMCQTKTEVNPIFTHTQCTIHLRGTVERTPPCRVRTLTSPIPPSFDGPLHGGAVGAAHLAVPDFSAVAL
jgi:hypothetical protein